jgi:hypothetical protein
MKNVVFWDVMPCGSCESRRLGGTYRRHHEGSSEMTVITRVTRRQSRGDGILHSHSCEYLESYNFILYLCGLYYVRDRKQVRGRQLHLCLVYIYMYKQTPWPLVRKQTIPTDRPPLVDEI